MSLHTTFHTAKSLAQELGLGDDIVASTTVPFIFNHFSRQIPYGLHSERMRYAFENAAKHLTVRTQLDLNYRSVHFGTGTNADMDALTIAVYCSPYLTQNTKLAELTIQDLPGWITQSTVDKAYQIQQEAIRLKEQADLDFRPTKVAANDGFSKEAYYLGILTLLDKMIRIDNAAPTYDEMSDHLRYDLLCAPKYIAMDTAFDRAVIQAVDMMEDKMVEELKGDWTVEVFSLPQEPIAFPHPRR